MNLIKIFCITLFLYAIVGCSPVKIALPNEADLLSAKYGSPPDSQEIPNLIKKYLKSSGYRDPNSVEIEDCSVPKKGWMHAAERWEPIFIYGWEVECDINAKNAMGGYIGFSRQKYLYKDMVVQAGHIPNEETHMMRQNQFNGKNSDPNQVLWK